MTGGFDGETPFFRLDFSDETAWQKLSASATAVSEEGFRAYLSLIDDRALAGSSTEDLARLAAVPNLHLIFFVADALAMTHPDSPILCVELDQPFTGRVFRVIPREMWKVENNLAIANMDFDEFLSGTDTDGIFRGFES